MTSGSSTEHVGHAVPSVHNETVPYPPAERRRPTCDGRKSAASRHSRSIAFMIETSMSWGPVQRPILPASIAIERDGLSPAARQETCVRPALTESLESCGCAERRSGGRRTTRAIRSGRSDDRRAGILLASSGRSDRRALSRTSWQVEEGRYRPPGHRCLNHEGYGSRVARGRRPSPVTRRPGARAHRAALLRFWALAHGVPYVPASTSRRSWSAPSA